MPQYRFDQADVIVSFDADFLGTWISPVQYTRGYTSRRRISERRADEVLSRPDRVAAVADRIECRSAAARRARRDRARGDAPGGEAGAARRDGVCRPKDSPPSPVDAALDAHRRSAVDGSRPRSGGLGQPGRARPGAVQLHQPDDRRLRHDRRSGAPVVPARGQRRGARRAARPSCRAAKSGRCSSPAPTRCTTCRTAPRWPTTSGACRWS